VAAKSNEGNNNNNNYTKNNIFDNVIIKTKKTEEDYKINKQMSNSSDIIFLRRLQFLNSLLLEDPRNVEITPLRHNRIITEPSEYASKTNDNTLNMNNTGKIYSIQI